MEKFSEQFLKDLKKYHLQQADRIEQSLKERKLGKYSESQDAEEQNASTSRQLTLHTSLSCPESQDDKPKEEHKRNVSRIPKRVQSMKQPNRPTNANFIRDKKQEPGSLKNSLQPHSSGTIRRTTSTFTLTEEDHKHRFSSKGNLTAIYEHPAHSTHSAPLQRTISLQNLDSTQEDPLLVYVSESKRQNKNQDYQRRKTNPVNRSQSMVQKSPPEELDGSTDKRNGPGTRSHFSRKSQLPKYSKSSAKPTLSKSRLPAASMTNLSSVEQTAESQSQNVNQDYQREETNRSVKRSQTVLVKVAPQDLDPRTNDKNKASTRNHNSQQPKSSTKPSFSETVRPAASMMNLSSVDHTTGHVNRLETFKKLPGTQNLGREFEQVMCAFYALMLTMSAKVENFKMSSNNADDGKFDDIGLQVRFQDGNFRKYIIQLKYKENKKILITNLKSESEKGDFAVKRYIEAISKMNLDGNTVCILFTNCSTIINKSVELGDAVTLKQCPEFEYKDVLVNSTENSQNKIFEIEAENLKQKFFFFTSQRNVRQTEEEINTLLKSILQSDIYGAFMSFIKDWWFGKFILTKHDVVAKIAELAFSPYLATLTDKKCNEKTENLKQVILSFPLVIVEDSEENIIADIWKIEEFWINQTFGKTKSKYGLKEDQQNKTLWYLGKLPLILRVDSVNAEMIKSVMSFLRKHLEHKKIILIGKLAKNDFPEWDTLENLLDIMDKPHCSTILQEFQVSYQGLESIPLEDLVSGDEDIVKLFGTRELLQMTQQDSVHFGNQKIKEKLSETHIPRSVSPIFVKKEEIFNCYKSSPSTILVVNCDQSFADTLSENKDVNIMELSDYLAATPDEERANFILPSTKSKCTNQEFETICKKSDKFKVYLVQQFDSESCILLFRKGRKLGSENSSMEKAVKESKIFEVYNNSLHVFCAPPGMGKSTLMKVLHNDCPCLSVYVRLIDHNPFFEEQPDVEAILGRFLQVDGTGNDLCRKLRKHFWKNQKLYMFLDGLDEVYSEHLDCVLNFVKYASSQGGHIWLSSRENLRETICQTLNVVPIDMRDLDHEEQKIYINSKLKEQYKIEEIRKITKAVFKSADLNNSQKLLGIPLQLHIITEMFHQDKQVYENLETKNPFVLSQMYRIYFEGKIKFAYNKVENPKLKQQLSHLKAILQMYELPALTVCLQKEDCKRLHIDVKEVEEFLDEIRTEGDKNGIIQRVNENHEVVFEHQTYAEYFTCIWLKKNPDKFKELGDKIFTKEYENLRLIFDVILAENNPLHLTVIYNDAKDFQKRFKEPNPEYDEGGRTVFHLAFSYGRKYPPRVEIRQKYIKELRTLKREKEYYMEIIQTLLKDAKIPDTEDGLFAFDCISYGLQSGCLYPIEEILRAKSLTFDKLEEPLKKRFDEMALAYCSAQFGYPNLLSELVKSHVVAEAKKDLLEVAMKGCDGDMCTPQRDGNIAAVEILIGNDAFPKTKMVEILQDACEKKLFDMLEMLIEKGAKCSNGNTILHHLVERCPETYCDEIVKTIEKFEIDVNAPNNKGVTALHKAAESADLKIVEALMENGADPNIVDQDGRNALHHASSNSRQEVIVLFLTKSLPVDGQDKNGATALHLASEKCKTENVKLLLANSADFNLVDKDKNNALHYASRSRTPNQHVISLLAEKGLSVNEKNQNGQTPVHLACERNNTGNIKMLLERAADLNLDDNDGNSLFNYALKSLNCKDIVKLLKLHGFDVNRKNQDGLSPIHFAYREENFVIVDFLLEIGADDEVNAKFTNGETLLHWACAQKKYNLASVLLERGADPNATDNNDRNALYHSLSQLYLPDLVHAMLRHGLNFKTRYQNGQTLLHFACYHCDTHTVRELCEKNVDVNTLDDDQRNPLDDVLRRLSEVEQSVKMNLETRYKSYTSTHHEHEPGRIHSGCINCYCKLVKTLGEVDEDTNFEDFVKQKLSMFIKNDKVLDIFLKDVVSTDSANDAMDIVARFMIFEMVNYIRENGLKINSTSPSDETEQYHSSDWEQKYPEIGDLLNSIS